MRKEKTKARKILDRYALKLLSYRPRSKAELRSRLILFARKKKIDNAESEIDNLVLEFEENKKIDDLEFAKWWVGQRIEFKPRGKRLLRFELRKKGVDDKLIDEAIGYFWKEQRDIFGIAREAVSEDFLAKKAAKKQAKKYAKEDKESYIKKMLQFLVRKGFDYNTALNAAEEVREKANG